MIAKFFRSDRFFREIGHDFPTERAEPIGPQAGHRKISSFQLTRNKFRARSASRAHDSDVIGLSLLRAVSATDISDTYILDRILATHREGR